MRKTEITRSIAGHISLLLSFIILATLAQAGEPVIWETNSRAEILKGEARGVSVTDTGAFMLAPRMTQLFNTEQAFIWSSAVDAAFFVSHQTGAAHFFTMPRNWT
jgi:hypothetical protein